jgi:hypothetical protein
LRFARAAITLIVPLLLALSMVVYVNRILRAQQIADAAAHDRPRGNLSDLYPRWVGARELLLHRRDPYGADVTREIQVGYYGRPIDPTRPNDPKDQQAFAYPLYVVLLLAPTVRLPFSIVQAGFLWLLVGLTAVTVLVWLRVLGWRISPVTQIPWIVLTLGSFPAIQGFKLQQLTLLVAALIAGAMYAISTRRFVWAGILLALATIKPQLVFLMVLWLFLWCLGNWRERGRLICSFAIAMAVLLGASESLRPGWIHEFRDASAAYYQYTGGGKSVLDVFFTPLWGRTLAAVLLIIAVTLLWRARQANETSAVFHWSLALVLATTLVVIPMFAPYNQLLLLAPLMLIVRALREVSREGPLARLFLGLAAVCVAWPWIAAMALAIALLFLPAAIVLRGWAMPLYTSLIVPIAVLLLLLVTSTTLRSLQKA